MSSPAHSPAIRSDAVLIGCGDLGTRIGLLLASDGRSVVGLRRNVAKLPTQIDGYACDLTNPSAPLPPISADMLVVALTAGAYDEQSYRRTYFDGMRRALAAVAQAGQLPRRAVLVSSTSVFGDLDDSGREWTDELTSALPSKPSARVLHEAEQLFIDRIPGGVVLRLSGLYGRSHARLFGQVERGENPEPGRWTNRIHRDDAASAVVHLLGLAESEPLYIGTDNAPVSSNEVRAFVASQLGVRWQWVDATPHGKRLSNARLRATDWEPTYPSYREGYAALLTL